jgi:alpha-pyrone synthase
LSYIVNIATAVPRFRHQQKQITSFFVNASKDENTRRKLEYISKKSGIDTRYSIINDFSSKENDSVLFHKTEDSEKIPSLTQRMDLYKEHALPLALEAINKIKNIGKQKKAITHIITVSCTGLFAPGLDIELIQELNLRPNIQRSSINFMGCNAAILALKNADAICNSTPHALVLIVCVELCTIHFQNNSTDDFILSNTLFGDGAAAVLVSSKPNEEVDSKNIHITSFDSLIISKGKQDMAWRLSETGFIMNLTSYVSELINGNMKEFLKDISLDKTTIDFWAVHPGGKKIVDGFAEAVDLKNSQLQSAYDVLEHYGNMSSPTILFVLKDVIESNVNAQKGQTIFSAAFGPGLSIETMQLQYV